MQPPKARVEAVEETHFGITTTDPYRWLEDWEGDEAGAWLRAQGAYARSVLEALPHREALLARVTELHGGATRVSDLAMVGDRTFYLRQEPGAGLPSLVVRDTREAPARVLVDPAAIPGEAHSAIDWYVPSPDGRLLAYGVSEGGSENSTLRLLEVAGGTSLDDQIPAVHYPFVSWLEDGLSFVYHRHRDVPAGTDPRKRRDDSRSCLHHIGDDPERDLVVLERGCNPLVPLTPMDRPFLHVPATGRWMLALVSHAALSASLSERLSACTIYVAPRGGLQDPASCPWTRVAGVEDGVRALALDGDALYLVDHRGGDRSQVSRLDLAKLAAGAEGLAGAEVVVGPGERAIEAVQVVGGHLLVRDLDGGVGRLRQLPLGGGEPRELPLPVEGTIQECVAHPERPEALLLLTSWTVSPRLHRLDLAAGTVGDTGWLPPSPVDFSGIQASEVEVPARDGALVPMSVIHRKGLELDGANPVLLNGYGSYGLSIGPAFMPEMLAWYERGGVYAVAHLRGGGERGRRWHHAGRLLRKETTITDFIDCAEYLVARGYTRPDRLAGEGGSAGGIPAGGALVRRPELWAAMVMAVPVANTLRIEFSENGPINVPEHGTVTTPDGLRTLMITDSYARVRDGVAYPAVLLTAGMNDRRVPVWQPGKMAARLQAATGSERPVLLRVEERGGHGFGSTQRQLDELLADELAFLLEQLGL